MGSSLEPLCHDTHPPKISDLTFCLTKWVWTLPLNCQATTYSVDGFKLYSFRINLKYIFKNAENFQ